MVQVASTSALKSHSHRRSSSNSNASTNQLLNGISQAGSANSFSNDTLASSSVTGSGSGSGIGIGRCAGGDSGGYYGSLFWHMNHCKSPFGQRCLREWLATPLIDVKAIKQRQATVVKTYIYNANPF